MLLQATGAAASLKGYAATAALFAGQHISKFAGAGATAYFAYTVFSERSTAAAMNHADNKPGIKAAFDHVSKLYSHDKDKNESTLNKDVTAHSVLKKLDKQEAGVKAAGLAKKFNALQSIAQKKFDAAVKALEAVELDKAGLDTDDKKKAFKDAVAAFKKDNTGGKAEDFAKLANVKANGTDDQKAVHKQITDAIALLDFAKDGDAKDAAAAAHSFVEAHTRSTELAKDFSVWKSVKSNKYLALTAGLLAVWAVGGPFAARSFESNKFAASLLRGDLRFGYGA